MQLNINLASSAPLYKQITDSIMMDIHNGTLPAGTKLPTVRQLADEAGIARGTVKHAYDTLEQLGFIEKTQGRGTFVSTIMKPQSASKKEQAMVSIDQLLDELIELSFSLKDIRIILDLKLREREQQYRNVRLGAVDCSPEALAMISKQISALPHVDVYEYPLEKVLERPASLPENLDMIITTNTHYHDLTACLPQPEKLYRMVLSVAAETVSRLARIPEASQVGILSASKRFADIIGEACTTYCLSGQPPATAIFGDPQGLATILKRCDQLVLPVNYLKFCSASEQERIHAQPNPPIIYRYEIDKGSLLHLEEQIEKIYKANLGDN